MIIYMCYKKIALTALSIAILDGIVIGNFLGSSFGKMVKKIQNSEMKVNLTSTVFAYIVLIFQVYYFVIKQKISLFDSFLLGSSTYAIFDLTNYSLFKNYDAKVAIIDILWGGTLYTLTNYIVNKL